MAINFDFQQVTPPERLSFAITLERTDREEFARQYGLEIDRALQARRFGTGTGGQWYGDVPESATKATRVVDTGRVTVKSWEEQIQDYWARYEMIPPARELPFDGAANFRTSLTKWMIDAVLARIMAGLATIRPIYRVEAIAPDTAGLGRAGRIEEFLDYVLEHELDFISFLDDALLNSAVEGAAIGYVTWIEKREHRLVEEVQEQSAPILNELGQPMMDGLGGSIQKTTPLIKVVEREDVVEARPNLDLIPLTDFLVADPSRKRLADQPWMGHRTTLYRAELAQLRGVEGYIGEELDELLAGSGNQTTGPSMDIVEQGIESRIGIATGPTTQTAMRMLDKFEVWTLICWYDWDQDGKPERVVAEVAMPQKRLIRLIKYPYLHNRPFYVPISLLPRSTSFYPRSLAGDLIMSQDELDAMTNQRIDATAIGIASLFMFLYDEQAGFDPARTRIRLGGSIKLTGDINHLTSLAKIFRGVSVPGMEIITYIIEMARQLSGIHEMQTGGIESKRATAFEIGAVLQEGNVKFRRMIERVSTAIAEIAYQVIALYQQNGDRSQGKVFRVLNDQENPFRTIEMGELFGRWNYRVHGMAIASQRDMDAKKALEVITLVEKSPIFRELVGIDPLRKYHLARTFLDKIGWPVEDLIGKEEQLIAFIQAKQAQAAQPPQGGPQGPPGAPGGGTTQDLEKFVQERLARGSGEVASATGLPGADQGEAGMAAVQEGTGL